MKKGKLFVIVLMLLALPFTAASAAFAGSGEDAFSFDDAKKSKALMDEVKKYPNSFDLRNVDTNNDKEGDTSYITPVRLQNPFGTCWGFAAVAAAESSILSSGLAAKDGLDENTLDLSEKHLSYFATSYIDDEDDPQNGEGYHFENLTEEDLKTSEYRYNTGGRNIFATTMFASGIGPNREDRNDPDTGKSMLDILSYKGARGEMNYRRAAISYDEAGNPTAYARRPVWYDDKDDWSIDNKYRYYQSYRLKNSFILPNPSGNDPETYEYVFNPDGLNAIKEQMYDHKRAVSIAFSAESYLPGQDTTGKKYMSDKWAHYTYTNDMATHAVTVVGWDDDYPKENFLEGHQPPKDGAFLIKNSWGSELNDFPNNGLRHWGLLEGLDGVPYNENAVAESDRSTGYFWLSYYDQSIMDPETFEFDRVTGENGYYVEQYDYAIVDEIDRQETPGIKMANMFKAEETSLLSDVSVLTSTPGTEVTCKVYLNSEDSENPEDGPLISEGSGTFPYGGYHKIELDTKKVLAKGQKYSVVIEEKSGKGDYIPFTSTTTERAGSNMYSVIVVNKGESFVYGDDAWHDLAAKGTKDKYLPSGYDFTEVDNFPIKSYLEPVMIGEGEDRTEFKGNLVANNYSIGDVSSLDFFLEDSITLTSEIKGMTSNMPDDWDPDVAWKISDPNVASIEEDATGNVVVTAKDYGKAYITLDAGEYGTRMISVTVRKPVFESMVLDPDGGKLKLTYNGKARMPKPVTISDETCDPFEPTEYKEGVDYELKYKNNKNAGIATVTLVGIGKYAGEISDTFTITKANNTMKAVAKNVTVKYSALKKKAKSFKRTKAFKISKAKGKLTFKKLKGSKKITVNKKTGKVTVKKGLKKGTYKVKVKVKAAGDKNYKAKSKNVTIKIRVK